MAMRQIPKHKIADMSKGRNQANKQKQNEKFQITETQERSFKHQESSLPLITTHTDKSINKHRNNKTNIHTQIRDNLCKIPKYSSC
jgi:hypothetical protein